MRRAAAVARMRQAATDSACHCRGQPGPVRSARAPSRWRAGAARGLPYAPALTGLYADPAIQHWHGYALDTQDEALKMIESWHKWWQAERAARWALAYPGGSLARQAGLLTMDLRAGAAECLYSTAPAFRGRGVAPSALEALASWAFLAGFHRLYLRHSVANPASCRVAVKSGFEAEGTERGAELHTDGWHEDHRHAGIATDEKLALCIRARAAPAPSVRGNEGLSPKSLTGGVIGSAVAGRWRGPGRRRRTRAPTIWGSAVSWTLSRCLITRAVEREDRAVAGAVQLGRGLR